MVKVSNSEAFKGKSFLERACGADESIIMTANIHWLFVVIGFVWLIVFAALGIAIDHFTDGLLSANPNGQTLSTNMAYTSERLGDWAMKFCFFIGIIMSLSYIVTYATTRVGLSNKRMLVRTGLISVDLKEVDLEEIKSEHVSHGLLGRFFDYGEIKLDARFVENFKLPRMLNKPYVLIRTAHEARAAIGDTVVVAATAAPPPPPQPQPQPHQPMPQPQAEIAETQIIDETEDHIIFKQKKV